jgi:hypothetical protein
MIYLFVSLLPFYYIQYFIVSPKPSAAINIGLQLDENDLKSALSVIQHTKSLPVVVDHYARQMAPTERLLVRLMSTHQ